MSIDFGFFLSYLYGPTVALLCVLIAGIAIVGAVNAWQVARGRK